MSDEFDIELLQQALSLSESEFDAFLEEYYNSLSEDQELSKSVYLKMGKHRDPKGGLTKEGIEYYNRKTGSNLKPGVTWKPRTAEDFRRKGSFLVRFYTNPAGPLVNEKGEPTRLAKAACLHYDVPVLLADGTTLPIGYIVENQLPVEVVCVDETTMEVKTARVTNWGKSPSSIDEFIEIGSPSGPMKRAGGQSITLTKDHLVLTNKGWVEAKDTLGLHRAIISEVPNQNMMAYIYGTLLGDSSIPKRQSTTIQTHYICCTHTAEHAELVEQKQIAFNAKDIKYKDRSGLTPTKQDEYYVASESLPIYSVIRSKWLHPSGRKGLPDDLEEVFNELSLAVWICDDGSLHEKVDGQHIYYSYRIHTECFTISEVDRLRKLLLDKYNIESTKSQRENCSGYVINIAKQDSVHKLSELISPYVPKSLRYKVKPEHREVEYIFPELNFSYDLGVVYIPITHHKVAEYGSGSKKRSKASYSFKYDIEVEGYHNFVANNTIVHNSKWGEPVPTTRAAAAKLAAKGRSLLEKAKRMKESRKRVKASINSAYEQYSIPSKNPGDYLVVEDRNKVSTYHLQVKENGVPNPRLMGAAWRALYHPSGHRGNPYKGPQKDKAKRKLRALYKSLGREMPRVQRHSLLSSSSTETDETNQELSKSLRLRNFIYNLVEKPLRRGTAIQSPIVRKLTSDEHADSNLDGFNTNTLDYQEAYSDIDFSELVFTLENSLSQLVNSDKYSNCSRETLELALGISKDIILSLLGLDLSESSFTEALDEAEYYLSESDENKLSVLNTESYSLEEIDIPEGFIFLTTVDRDCILKKYTFSDYSHAISFVNDIYNKAEEVGHHPIELLTIYNSPVTEVYIKLSTNDEQIGDVGIELNTVTLKDISLANYCNSIYNTHYKSGLSNSGNECLSNSDDIELTNYYIDQLNMALSDLKLSKEIDLDDYEAYSENIFLDKDKHQQAKAEAKLKFRVYPSVYANMWMVKRYKELGGRFAKRD